MHACITCRPILTSSQSVIIGDYCTVDNLDETRAALQIQDLSPKSRPVASLDQSQTQVTRSVATGLGMQRARG